MEIKVGQIWRNKKSGNLVQVVPDPYVLVFTSPKGELVAEHSLAVFEQLYEPAVTEHAKMIKPKYPSSIRTKGLAVKTDDKGVVTGIVHHKENASKPDMVNKPPHYKDASGIECIEVTQHMRFCEGNSFKYVYRADSKGNLIEDLKKAAWYAERSWNRNRTGNDRVHWLVKRRGEAIADSRDKEGKPFIAEVMRNIVNNRWWQAYDSLMTEIERLEAGNE